MKRFLATLLLLAATSHAWAVDRVLILKPDDADAAITFPTASGIGLKPPGVTSAQQFVIPRYRTGSSFPAGQIMGYGPGSEIRATSTTHSLTAASGYSYPGMVQTEGLGTALSQWQHTSDNSTVGILMPKLTDVSIEGYSADYNTHGDVDRASPSGNQGDPDLYWGPILEGMAGEVSNVNIFAIPGTALYFTRDGTNANQDESLQFDSILWHVRDVQAHRVFRGIYCAATDAFADNFEVWSFRDWGIRFGTNNSSGNIHGSSFHAYGGGYAGEPDGTGGAAIWVDGASNQLSNLYGENAPIGMLVSGTKNNLDKFQSIVCATANLKITGDYNSVTHVDINASTVGVDITGNFDQIAYGTITVNGTGAGVLIENGKGAVVDHVTIGNTSNTTKAIHVTGTLKHAYIVADVEYGGTGIDFSSGGAIGVGANGSNTIKITTSGGTATGATLPATWTNDPSGATDTTNTVLVNGVAYYPH